MIPTEPLKTPVETDPSLLLEALQCSRQQYSKLLLEKMRAPDGGYEEGFTLPGSTETPKRVRPDINLQRNNPLSLDTEVDANPILRYKTYVGYRIHGGSGLRLWNYGRQSYRMSNARMDITAFCTHHTDYRVQIS